MIDDEKIKFGNEEFIACNEDKPCLQCASQNEWDKIEDAPQEKQLIDEYFCSYCCAGIPPCTCPKAQAQPTSETYDQGRFIIVQDGDDEAFKNGNYYTAHLYFNSVQEWEIKEEYNTYLIR